MRRVFALAVCGLAAASFSAGALAEDPAKRRLGTPEPRSAPQPASKAPAPGAGQGDASRGASSGSEDERKATESKEKAKKRPGYKDEAPSPRA